jgi:hypothetical protein
MLPISHEMMYFDIPAEKVSEIVAWIHLTNETYMRRQMERSGRVTLTRLDGKSVLESVDRLPPLGTAEPHYGMIEGVYGFIFIPQGNDTILRIHYGVKTAPAVEPYKILLGAAPQFGTHTEPKEHWDFRLESLIDNPAQSRRIYIDGVIYANMLAAGWQKESAQGYRYEFVPTTIGCMIYLHNAVTDQSHDLTANINW